MLKPLSFIFLSLEQKLDSLTFFAKKRFFAVDKINIIFVLAKIIVSQSLLNNN